MDKQKVILHGLGIELTRRCNLNCDFCSKGMPQNMDITKAIIDKTMDELKDTYISHVRLTGGEPLLAPEMLEYLVDSIIANRIKTNWVTLFSNGMVRDERLILTFRRLTQYLREIEPEIRDLVELDKTMYTRVYKGTENAKCDIIISTSHHYNQDMIDDTLRFYRQVNDPDFVIVSQSDTFEETAQEHIIIEGRAIDNLTTLLSEPVDIKYIRRIRNQYFLITNYVDDKLSIVKKTISISANGNIYPGCMQSYTNIDSNPMLP